MKNFNRDSKSKAKRGGRDFNRDSGRKSFGGSGRNSFKKNSDSREMFSTICSECGKACGVPFKPTDNRPVLCKGCFKKQQDDGSYSKREDRGGFSKSNFSGGRHELTQNNRQDSAQFEALNNKLDEVLEILRSLTFLVNDNEIEELPEELEEKPKAKAKTVKKTATKTKSTPKRTKK